VSFGSFYKGIHRSTTQRGPAALTLTTSLKDPYADRFDTAGGSFTYAYRSSPRTTRRRAWSSSNPDCACKTCSPAGSCPGPMYGPTPRARRDIGYISSASSSM
jgi:hypothetical protein